MRGVDLLVDRLRQAGMRFESVTPSEGGVVAHAGVVTLDGGRRVFAKTLPGPDSDVFVVEAEGLRVLAELGGADTPQVQLVTPNLLVLELMEPVGDDGRWWERAGRMVAALHTRAVGDRFGWDHDGWLGRFRQDNTWDSDGYAFYAQRRILRWLPEPLVEAAFDRSDRDAIERLCAALPDLVPPQPPVLTHGDLWANNMLSRPGGGPVLIDPAVSYNWAETDLSMLWLTPRPAGSDRFFDAYHEVAPLVDGWRDRMPVLYLRELLAQIAHGDGHWGAPAMVRKIVHGF